MRFKKHEEEGTWMTPEWIQRSSMARYGAALSCSTKPSSLLVCHTPGVTHIY
jgi:hypothetical protein